jgi:ankyrin repeat protein
MKPGAIVAISLTWLIIIPILVISRTLGNAPVHSFSDKSPSIFWWALWVLPASAGFLLAGLLDQKIRATWNQGSAKKEESPAVEIVERESSQPPRVKESRTAEIAGSVQILSGPATHLDPAMVQATLRVKAAREAFLDRFSSKGNYGKTPLHTAAAEGNKDVAESLVADADMTRYEWMQYVNAKDIFGETALFKAAEQGHRNMVEWLLTYRADVNTKNIEDNTPLHIAASKGDKVLAELLLANRANVKAKNARGVTPFYAAASSGRVDVAQLLLTQGADVNDKNGNGDTLLHTAASWDDKALAKLLLTHGVDVNAKNSHGDTPLRWAMGNQKHDMAELLRQHGGHE